MLLRCVVLVTLLIQIAFCAFGDFLGSIFGTKTDSPEHIDTFLGYTNTSFDENVVYTETLLGAPRNGKFLHFRGTLKNSSIEFCFKFAINTSFVAVKICSTERAHGVLLPKIIDYEAIYQNGTMVRDYSPSYLEKGAEFNLRIRFLERHIQVFVNRGEVGIFDKPDTFYQINAVTLKADVKKLKMLRYEGAFYKRPLRMKMLFNTSQRFDLSGHVIPSSNAAVMRTLLGADRLVHVLDDLSKSKAYIDYVYQPNKTASSNYMGKSLVPKYDVATWERKWWTYANEVGELPKYRGPKLLPIKRWKDFRIKKTIDGLPTFTREDGFIEFFGAGYYPHAYLGSFSYRLGEETVYQSSCFSCEYFACPKCQRVFQRSYFSQTQANDDYWDIVPKAERFNVIFLSENGVPAFTLSVRFSEGVIVRNTFDGERWETEVRDGGMPLSAWKIFDMTIKFEEKDLAIYFQGDRFGVFTHRAMSRQPFYWLYVDGDVELHRIELNGRLAENSP